MTAAPATDPQATVAAETARRRPVGLVALVSALLTFAGGVLNLVSFPRSERDPVTLVEALQANAQGQTDIIGRSAETYALVADGATGLVLGRVATALGALGLVVVLLLLLSATRARRPGGSSIMPLVVGLGGTLLAVGTIAGAITLVDLVKGFAAGDDRSNSAFFEAFEDAALVGRFQDVTSFGALFLGGGMIVTCLGAMRVGLLTRFLGVLGILIGATLVLSTAQLRFDEPPVIRSLWLLAVGLLLLGKLPTGTPAAWASGTAEPWPSAREQAAAKAAQRPAKATGAPKADGPPDAPAPTPRPAHSSSKKRRKKRR